MDPRPIDVVKVGGHELDDAGFVAGLAQAVKAAHEAGRAIVVVHGGGRAIAELQSKLGLTVRVVDGLRVTDGAALDVAEMALSGLANKRLVAAFVAVGLDALGLSGVDRGLLRCRMIEHPTADLGRVGEVDAVRVDVLRALLADGVLPVISPISLGPDGRSVNVNADTAAAAVAGALGAERLVLLSNVPGVRLGEGVAPRLDEPSVVAAVASGAIAGGMIPKVGAALAAVRAGIAEARIVDLAGWASGGGTAIVGTVDEAVDKAVDKAVDNPVDSALSMAPSDDAVSIRPAVPDDVPAIAALVAEFARRGDVLPRPPAAIRVTLGDWVVGVAGGRLVACGALFRYGAGLAEVRTTIVADGWQGRGVGRRIVDGVIALAAARGIPTVFTLTRRAPFFERLGFQPADKATFPEKVWKDCRTCPLIDDCDEIALRLDLVDGQRWGDGATRPVAPDLVAPAIDVADPGATTNIPIIHDPRRADAARAPETRRPLMVNRPTVHRVVLAYSGGLDTSVIVPWLREEYGCEVVCFCADLGQGEELEGLRDKALASGAIDCVIEDLRDVFARDYVFPMLQAGAVYERQYLLGTAIARPLIAMRQVAVAEMVGADAVAHGCTGKGNDQVRFELTYQALNPTLHVIAPWREWTIRSREDALAYADAHNVPIASREKSVYSRDRNLWHISHEGGRLEDPRLEPEADMFLWTVDPRNAPDTPEDVEIGFEAGVPVTVNGEALDPAALIDRLNVLAARHGVGRVDIVENRLVGMKSRGVYETPGGTLLYAAHREIESLCLDRETAHYKEQLAGRYAELVYFGQWFHPLREGVQSFITRTQESVTGWARLRVFKGGVTVLGRYSPHSLYREDFATFGRDDVYDQTDAAGFINLFGLAMKMRAMMEVSGGGRTRYAAPDFSQFKRD